MLNIIEVNLNLVVNGLSQSEENYLKEIFHLGLGDRKKVSTNSLAEKLGTKASSITDMLKKLADKDLISYERYRGCQLTGQGIRIAVQIVRTHRLWETFLVSKMGFRWDEVHDLAEQLEHVHSAKLVDGLDKYLGFPKFDPHGDPIPDKRGNILDRKSKIPLCETAVNSNVEIVGVTDDSLQLLRYLDEVGLKLGTKLRILEKYAFDESLKVRFSNGKQFNLSNKVAANINVRNVSKT